MKNIKSIILISTVILTLFACKKDKSDEDGNIIGYWELAETVGGVPLKEYPAGNGNILEFTKDTYKQYSNGQVIKSGVYTTMKDNTAAQSLCGDNIYDHYTRRIVYDNADSARKTFYEISNGRLTFISGCFINDSGQKEVYRRIKNN